MQAKTLIRQFITVSGLFSLSSSIIWGINTLFLLDAGLDIVEVFMANAAYTAGNVLFEIPTGVVADTLGRRVSFLACIIILAITTFAYVWLYWEKGSVYSFMLVSAFMGLGFTFYSGAIEAWIVDGLKHAKYDGKLETILAIGSSSQGATMLIGASLGGFIGQYDLAAPYLLRSALLILLISWGMLIMRDVGFSPKPLPWRKVKSAVKQQMNESFTHGWQQSTVRWLILAGLFQGGYIIWAFYAAQPYFLQLLEQDAVWISGVIASAVALSMMLGNSISVLLSRRLKKRTTLIIAASLIQGAFAIGIGVFDSFIPSLICFILTIACMGVYTPIRQSYLHQRIPSEQRATIISFDSMFSNSGGIVAQIGLAQIAKQVTMAAAYVVGGLSLLASLPWYSKIRQAKEKCDSF